MLNFEGEKDLSQGPAELYPKLSDARFLVQCIPGAAVVGEPEADLAVCKVKPALSFVTGSLEVIVRLMERVPDRSVCMFLYSKGIGSSSTVEATLKLAPQDGGTRLRWYADVTQLGGLLKAVPSGLIRGAAQKVINDVWNNIEAKLKE
jgi:carbon monoxide dehydrogenase subunit G